LKIRTQLALAFVILISTGFFMLVNWLSGDILPHHLKTMEESLVDFSTLLAVSLQVDTESNTILVTELRNAFASAEKRRFQASIYDMTKTGINMRVYVTDRSGSVIFDSDGGKDEGLDYSKWNNVFKTMHGEYGARTTRTDPDDPKSAVLHISAPIMNNGNIIGTVTVCKPIESVNQFIITARHKLLKAGLVTAFVTVLLTIIISAWVTRPIRKLIVYAQGVRDGRRVSVPKLGRSEIGSLSTAFEEMRDALEGRRYVESYIQTMAHEIKSPLAAIRGAVELLEENMPLEKRKQFLENIRNDSERIKDIINRLLELSSLENRKELREIESIEINELVNSVVNDFQPLLVSRKITIDAKYSDSSVVKGERFLIRQAVSNLVQNAIEFSPDNGTITVEVIKDDSACRITICDRGPGVPEYALTRVFDKFYSLCRPNGKKSSGLGLAFVKEVAVMHNGEAQIKNSPAGGAEASLTLPL